MFVRRTKKMSRRLLRVLSILLAMVMIMASAVGAEEPVEEVFVEESYSAEEVDNTEGEDITQDIADRLVMKMLQMACQNGISGMGTNPSFVFGTEIAQTGRAATGTAPQKMTVQYQLTYKVMNAVTGDVSTENPAFKGCGFGMPLGEWP